jgi:hypothetical protein
MITVASAHMAKRHTCASVSSAVPSSFCCSGSERWKPAAGSAATEWWCPTSPASAAAACASASTYAVMQRWRVRESTTSRFGEPSLPCVRLSFECAQVPPALV